MKPNLIERKLEVLRAPLKHASVRADNEPMRKEYVWFRLVSVACLALVWSVSGQSLAGKKALYINSYHPGYAWSDEIEKTILGILNPAGVQTKVVRLDTYRQKSPEYLAKVSQETKALIDEWKPEVVLVSDDAGMKGVYAAFYRDSAVPFVSCGVNWDASAYGVPGKNVTAMIEVCPIKELLAEMNKLKAGRTLGFLGSEGMTPQKDWEMTSKILGVRMEAVFAKDLAGWKQGFLDLQGKVDLLIIGVNAGIGDWNEADAVKFVEANAKVVSGSWHDYLNGLSLLAFNKLGSEQGEWAADAALKILKGTPVSSIPLTTNKKGQLVVNVRIAKKVGVMPAFDTLQSAKVIE